MVYSSMPISAIWVDTVRRKSWGVNGSPPRMFLTAGLPSSVKSGLPFSSVMGTARLRLMLFVATKEPRPQAGVFVYGNFTVGRENERCISGDLNNLICA